MTHVDPAVVLAAAGAAWLDRAEPGWAARIDLDRFDMASGCDCIGGQLRESFWRFRQQHRLSPRRYEELGFLLPEPVMREEYGPLEAAWRAQILNRRELPP